MPNSFTRASATIVLPKTATARNIQTKLDDHGYFASLERLEGESVTNFRRRLGTVYTRPGNAALEGLLDAIARELSLGHDALITVTSSRSLKLDVTPEYIAISGRDQYDTVDIVNVDVDGYWVLPNVGTVVSGLNGVGGISAVVTNADYATIPAMLLEQQSSWVTEYEESVPPSTTFRLGYYERGQEVQGQVISGTVSFSDDVTFAVEVSGTPRTAGQWSLDMPNNSINSYSLPTGPVNIVYTYSLLESGMSMDLIGNGCQIFNLMQPEVQSMLFRNSGIGATAQEFIDELRHVDKSFWGQ